MYSGIMRLSLWATNRAKKGQTDPGSALLYSHLDGARVARQHCSTLRLGNTILSLPCPAWIGHFYFGEIGHFYFGLTQVYERDEREGVAGVAQTPRDIIVNEGAI